MTDNSVRRPAAVQGRSRRSEQEFLRAGFSLLEEGGVEALTVAAVAERAGMSVGSVYRRFGDKEGLLYAIHLAFTDMLRAEVTQRVSVERLRDVPDPAAAIAEAVGGFADAFQAREGLVRVFLLLGIRHAAVRELGTRVSVEGNLLFSAALERVPVAHPDRAVALDFAYRLMYAGVAHRITQGEFLESDRPLPWSALKSRLQETVVAYLLGGPEPH
ncbi:MULTISPECIES: TetR/AcrR family transcriptional regulator [Streptomyces]|uniref:TetR/AcrR family transcriptional regulator n=1 Tax=Streptomyces phaeolivaceus TaxID=2653200 RepID=A0A5P8KEC2_9ACTN|nr:TetR/AcrR family transcriptional regulator [Streptomyces phaeolivaceus]QFR01684.1 TetR/AcrR family transcriptional regulator [Streptomyces phaeolivaceus]